MAEITTTADKLRHAIASEINSGVSEENLGDDVQLFEERIIDSLGIFTLVSFIQDEFDVEVLDEELVPENFGSIGALARFIDEKARTG
jgi:acyl carrier protein